MARLQKHWIQLREVLVDLYPVTSDIQRVASDAGFDIGRIPFNGSAQNTWHNIIAEAEKHNKLHDIVGIAIQEYPAQQRRLVALHRKMISGHGQKYSMKIQPEQQWKPYLEKTTRWVLSFYPRSVDQTIRGEIALLMTEEIRDAYQEGGFSRLIHRVCLSFGSLVIDITRERITKFPANEPDRPVKY